MGESRCNEFSIVDHAVTLVVYLGDYSLDLLVIELQIKLFKGYGKLGGPYHATLI